MTRNQLTYWQNQETKRSNLENERIKRDANIETNRSNLAREQETHRSNVANLTETYRSNREHEKLTKRQQNINAVTSVVGSLLGAGGRVASSAIKVGAQSASNLAMPVTTTQSVSRYVYGRD